MEPNYGYRHTRGFIVLLIIIFCGWVIVAHSQTSYTGNLVDTNWSNGYQVPELTCWGDARGSINCSPGGKPYIRPDGNINFSYSFTELYQARAIADVLPNSGTGLMATGFQFNWRSKNGNGWDDGRQDQLSAYVQMYSKGGQWIEAQSYNLSFIHDWTDFSWSGNFTKERRGSDLGTILYGFSGKDNNYFLGPYGPEITNVSFSLRYQPDPCVVNPLHSPECPGFMAAINKPIPGVAEASASYSIAATTQSNSTTSSPGISAAMSVIKLNAQRDLAAADAAVEQSTGTEKTSNQTSLAVAMPTNLVTSATKSVARSQDTQTTGQEQEQGFSLLATSKAAISVPLQISQGSRPLQRTDSQAKTESATESISLDQILLPPQSNQQNITSALVSTPPNRASATYQTQESDTDNTVQIGLVKMPEPTPVAIDQVQNHLMHNSGISDSPQVEMVRSPQSETASSDALTNTITNALIDRTNPLNGMLNGQQMTQTGPVFTGPAVKSNTADNDLAGGVSISQLARVPVGFDVYSNLAIREIAFYQPKEIYRGQRTVDNVRALRSLGQDARHQQMVDQQYLPR
jgi:hypothetical protein